MTIDSILKTLEVNEVTAMLIAIGGVLLVSALIFLIFRKIVLRVLTYVILKTTVRWDDALIKHKVFHKLTWVTPLVSIYLFAYLFPEVSVIIQRACQTLIIWVSLVSINAFLNAVVDVYASHPISKDRPIKGYIQIFKIFLFIVGLILMVGVLINRSPVILLSGLGAMTAILILIFKDTILSLVSSMQITFNNMIRIGDWLEMPQYGADGDVVDVALYHITIQNWDKTLTSIPTYKFTTESFKNWRGMKDSGARRIKRSIHIDVSTIRFMDDELMKQAEKLEPIRDYIKQRKQEIDLYNREKGYDLSIPGNGRRMTNIGTFRAYLWHWLQQHPKVNKNYTFLIRQLQSGPQGLPIEIYIFAATTEWIEYEGIQSDIFDHIFAVIHLFDLKIFQYPTGMKMLVPPERE